MFQSGQIRMLCLAHACVLEELANDLARIVGVILLATLVELLPDHYSG